MLAELQNAWRWPLLGLAGASALAGVVLLARPDAPGPLQPLARQAAALLAPPDTLLCPTCTPRRDVREPGPRGRVLDRRDSVLVETAWAYTLVLPRARAAAATATASAAAPAAAPIQPLDSAKLNRALGWRAGTVQRRVKADRPDAALQNRPPRLPLSAAEAAALRQHLLDHPRDWPVGLAVRQQRRRLYRTATAAHLLGWWTADAPGFLRMAGSYRRGRFVRLRSGGVESYYHGLLVGHRGIAHPLVDSAGTVRGTWATDTAYQAPQDLHLSLDPALQAYAERLLGQRRGYVIALEPSTGEILCAASGPVYDPAALTDPDRPATRRDLLTHEDMPLLNRPALLANPPGSVFKLVNAAAALQLGAIRPGTGFACNQELVNCVHHHPKGKNLTTALKYSCNPYFYQVLRALMERPDGPDTCIARRNNFRAWRRVVRSFGLDSVLGTDLTREAPGYLPPLALYDRVARDSCRWGYRRIFSLSLGQGEINLTGLQTANVLAAIANRGWYKVPHVVRSIGENGPLARFQQKHYVLVDSANLAALVPGMVAALTPGGTAETASLADVGITVAGKTGTVQNDEGDDHANFAGFAPADKPEIVVAVYLENAGFGGKSAAPLGALLMEKYLRGTIAPRRRYLENRLRAQGKLRI